MIYTNYQRNHAILPDSEQALHQFLNASIVINGEEKKHKLEYATNSNSEDALTWSCFDRLRNLPKEKITIALNEIFEDAFGDFKEENKAVPESFSFADEQNIEIHIGKNYDAVSVNESTEVDVSIETDSKLIFIEAKLYSKISMPDENRIHDQIARKLRVGLDTANASNRNFTSSFWILHLVWKFWNMARKKKSVQDVFCIIAIIVRILSNHFQEFLIKISNGFRKIWVGSLGQVYSKPYYGHFERVQNTTGSETLRRFLNQTHSFGFFNTSNNRSSSLPGLG